LKNGAVVVTSAADIFRQLLIDWPAPTASVTQSPATPVNHAHPLVSSLHQAIINQLKQQPNTAENLAQLLSVAPHEIMPYLTELEIGGIVRKNREQNYEISDC
jgi:predicted Rossmann fold nucleotide-binding protein DprA/Smf involved in DNA uptake